MARKRSYTHRKGRIIPVEHGSFLDKVDHNLGGTGLSNYKKKRKML